MDNLDFLAEGDDAPEQLITPEIEAEAPEQEQAAPEGPARGPDGKFAPKAPVAEAAPETPAEAPQTPAEPAAAQPAAPPAGFVPIGVVQELRKEIQALRVQAPTQPPPDPYEDLEGYQAHLQQERQAERLGYSRQIAELRHQDNPGLIDTVHDWALAKAGSDPVFNQRALSHPDPYGFAVEEYQREQALSLLADPKLLSAFQAFVSGQAPAQQAPAAVSVAAPPQQPIPPRSLAALPNAGGAKPGEQPVGPGVAFDAVFNSG